MTEESGDAVARIFGLGVGADEQAGRDLGEVAEARALIGGNAHRFELPREDGHRGVAELGADLVQKLSDRSGTRFTLGFPPSG